MVDDGEEADVAAGVVNFPRDPVDGFLVLAVEWREVDHRQLIGVGPAAQGRRGQGSNGGIHGLVSTILGERTNCHPERSEGPLRPQERSLAALGMTTACQVDSASMSSWRAVVAFLAYHAMPPGSIL